MRNLRDQDSGRALWMLGVEGTESWGLRKLESRSGAQDLRVGNFVLGEMASK